MVETISWSLHVRSSSGLKFASKGLADAEATMSATVDLPAGMTAATALNLQLAGVNEIVFLAIASSLADGSVEIQADGAEATKVTGPLVLHGDAVKLFANDLGTLAAQNSHATDDAELLLLIGRKLSPSP